MVPEVAVVCAAPTVAKALLIDEPRRVIATRSAHDHVKHGAALGAERVVGGLGERPGVGDADAGDLPGYGDGSGVGLGGPVHPCGVALCGQWDSHRTSFLST